MVEIELNNISRKYEAYRLKNNYRERQLLSSIVEKGITEPLSCIRKSEEEYILLDGYKRLRCLYKLKIGIVPVVSIGNDEQNAILQLIRLSNNKSLQTLEQSCFIDELHKQFGLTITDMADRLNVSPAWVSIRLGLIEKMSETVKQNIFSGKFPIRSYMYSIKRFTRVNNIQSDHIDRFISHVSGKKLSTRDIDTLAYGYFRGGSEIRKQIENGNISWTLRALQDKTASLSQESGLDVRERRIINDLEILQKYILKVIKHLSDPVSEGSLFTKNVCLLIEGITGLIGTLKKQLGKFYDK